MTNGYSVVKHSDPATAKGLTAALGHVPSSLPTVQNTPATAMPTGSSVTPAPIRALCFDLTKDKDDVVVPSSKEPDTTKAATKSKPEVSKKGIERTGLVSLSKHWDDKLKSVEGYVPLSIFNVNWLKQDLLKTTSCPRTSKDKDDKYVGLDVPVEWKMSFGEWVTAFDLFVQDLYYYEHGDLADGFKIHKENVFAIMRDRRCWPMAFRYDMAVRTTVLTLRNSDGKLANPGERNKELERDARLDSERLGDFNPRFADYNPYADGQIKSHINPISGERLRQNTPSFGPSRNDHSMSSSFGKPNARSWGFANQAVYEGPGAVNYSNFDDRGYGSRSTRGRGRGGGYGGGRDLSPRGLRGQDSYDNRRAEGSGSWRDDRREDRRGDERVPKGPKFGGSGKAK